MVLEYTSDERLRKLSSTIDGFYKYDHDLLDYICCRLIHDNLILDTSLFWCKWGIEDGECTYIDSTNLAESYFYELLDKLEVEYKEKQK